MFGGIKRTKADALFSNYIRELADYTCERCHQQFEKRDNRLHCSHYWSRRNRSVRFDKENAASLCFSCHLRMGENPHEHAAFFLKRLGKRKMDALEVRARTPQKVDEKEIVIGLTILLNEMKNNRKVLK